ncbi:Competence protein ComEC/Rec2 [Candidatus Magnetoovum chiemensis]|nr:Competence protein ComEC/Rec2 [Candidatus Magnetoovum chiemensis]
MHLFSAFVWGIVFFYSYIYFPYTSVIVFIVVLIFYFKKMFFSYILVIVIAFVYTWIRYEPDIELKTQLKNIVLSGVFTSLPVKYEYGYSQVFAVKSYEHIKSNSINLKRILKKPIKINSKRAFLPGSKVKLLANIKPIAASLNPDWFTTDYKVKGDIKKVIHIDKSLSPLCFHNRLRYELLSYFEQNVKEDVSQLLQAVTIGYTAQVSDDIRDMFSKTGLSHLLSISGTHFALIYTLSFNLILILIIYLIPYKHLLRISLRLSLRHLAAYITIPLLLAYLIISGMEVPALRSFIMISIVLSALFIGRKYRWQNSLSFAAFIILVIEPKSLFTTSFLLSFCCVIILCLVFDRFINHDAAVTGLRKFFYYLKGNIILSFCIIFGTAPIVAYKFHFFSLISPAANIIIVPYTCFIFLPIALFSSYCFLIAGIFPFKSLISLLGDILLLIVKIFANLDFSFIAVKSFPLIFVLLFYAVMLLLWVYKNKKIPAALVAGLFIIFAVYYLSSDYGFRAAFLYVGHGDASVVETSNNKVIVIDTGRTGSEVETYLKYRGRQVIDLLILSQAGDDHSGGLMRLLKRFKVKRLADNGLIAYPDELIEHKPDDIIHLKTAHRLRTGDTTVTVLNPFFDDSFRLSSDNNNSLVLKAANLSTSFLFTGDIEQEAEEQIMRLGKALTADVLKVAHHGSKTSSSAGFIKQVRPKYCVISAAKWNQFGHPHSAVLERLKGCRIFATYESGALLFKNDEENTLEVFRYTDYSLKPAANIRSKLRNIRNLFTVF